MGGGASKKKGSTTQGQPPRLSSSPSVDRGARDGDLDVGRSAGGAGTTGGDLVTPTGVDPAWSSSNPSPLRSGGSSLKGGPLSATSPKIEPGSGGNPVPLENSLSSVRPLGGGAGGVGGAAGQAGFKHLILPTRQQQQQQQAAGRGSGGSGGSSPPLGAQLSARSPLGLEPGEPAPILRWKKGELIGTGAYGRVYIGLNETTGGLMAVKEVRFSPEDQAEVESLRNEIDLMRSLAHQNIVRYLGTQLGGAGPGSENILSIFTEWVPGGSIHALVKKFGRLADPVIAKYTAQILAGVGYLHDKRVVHRDIKGANILVTDQGVIKVADFGASKVISETTMQDGGISDKLHGTPNFMAPEVIMSKDAGRKADIWSLGCTVFQMATGSAPWKALNFANVTSLMFHIANTKDPPPIPE